VRLQASGFRLQEGFRLQASGYRLQEELAVTPSARQARSLAAEQEFFL